MRIGIDLDNCGYPFAAEFGRYLGRRLGITVPEPSHWHFYRRDLALTDEQFGELLNDAVRSGDLWASAAPVPGFGSATWALADAGHTIIIATDRMQGTPLAKTARELTRTWLFHHRVNYDELLFTADKRDAKADVFIDDRPGAIPTLRLAGVDALYYNQPWNSKFPYPRVHSWAEFVKYVEDKCE